jgi:ribosomal protein L28
MGISYPHKIWNLGKAVAKKEELANPRRWGKIPFEIKHLKSIMPLLMHGKHITFGTVQRKYSHSRRAFIPNMLYRPLYSKALDMQVWCCVSATALREIDAWGGFDEYIVGVSEKKLGDDEITLMYKRKILEARETKKGTQTDSKIYALLKERYGDAYAQKIELKALES